MFAHAMPAQAAVFTVGGGGTHASIQSAINAAQAAGGDNEIRVRQGTYLERLQITLTSGQLQLSGGWHAGFQQQTVDRLNTQINAAQAGRALTVFADQAHLSISGFAFTGGRTTGSGGGVNVLLRFGSEMRMDTVTVAFNATQGSGPEDAFGMGMNITVQEDAKLWLSGCTIQHNQSINSAGGRAIAALSLTLAGDGQGAMQVDDCVLSNNAVEPDRSDGVMALWAMAREGRIQIENTQVLDHSTPHAGKAAVSLVSHAPGGHIRFVRNRVAGNGAAIQIASQALLSQTSTEILGNLVADGGTGIAANRDPGARVLLAYNTVSGHSVIGIRANAAPVWHNNIVFNNALEVDLAAAVPDSNLVGINPQFVDAAGGDYRLRADSPAIDTALDIEGVPLPMFDLDGRPRPIGLNHDIGAFEFEPEVFTDGFEPAVQGLSLTGPSEGDPPRLD